MKTANVRTVQHNLAKVLRWVRDGEEVEVTRRHTVVAKIVPVQPADSSVQHPSFVERSRRIWGDRVEGAHLSSVVREDRDERT